MNFKIETFDSYNPDHKEMYLGIANLTRSINDTYPGHNDWFFKKFVPELNEGKRKIVIAYDDLSNPMGVSLLKDTEEEKKICCLFVRDDCRNQGIAGKLMKQSCGALETKHPLITVADRNLSQLQKLLDKYDFKFSYKKTGAYKKEDTENYFNNEATEILKKDVLSPVFSHILNKQR